MRCLIVDDDPVSRKVLSVALAPYGTIHEAACGQEGIAKFTAALAESRAYQLVTLDVRMPDLDGHQVLEQLRAAETVTDGDDEACIVMVSCVDDAAAVEDAFRKRCSGYLVKPIDIERLFALLKNLGQIPESRPAAPPDE